MERGVAGAGAGLGRGYRLREPGRRGWAAGGVAGLAGGRAKAGKVAFDSKALHQALAARGVELRGVDVDLLLAAYVATPSAIPRTLDDLAFRRRGIEVEPALPDPQVVGGLMRPDPEDVAVPAALRAALALALAEEMDAEIDDLKLTELLHDVEMPLALVLSEMERRGIRLDGGALGELSREMGEEIAELQSAIYADAGHEFNVNSPKQLGTVLFDELGLPAGRKTKTGYSTASGVLEGLVDANPIAGRVLEYRELSKLKSTYIDTLPDLAHPTTGRLHTTFNQAGTATGRLSSANPNLQNIPIRTARGREIRRAFVAERADWTLLAIDYSQIDLRVLAHISEDAAMCEAFANGHDIHAATAASLHEVAAGRGDRGHAAAGQDDELRDRVRDQRPGAGVAHGVLASGSRDVHRDVLRDVSGREDLHGFHHRGSPRSGLRGDAVSAAAVSAGAQFAGVPRAGGGRADGDQHADPGHDRRHHEGRDGEAGSGDPRRGVRGADAVAGARRPAVRVADRRA